MITTSVILNTTSVIPLNTSLVCSCNDLSLCCQVDLISPDLSSFLHCCLEVWRSGRPVSLIYTGGVLSDLLPLLQGEISFPVSCKIVESSRYQQRSISEEWVATDIESINRDLTGSRNIKGITIVENRGVFVTGCSNDLTIVPVQPKLTLKMNE